ncbi:MAG: DUF2147 domain-containing protein [Hyphomicrobiaceae bacterium]
MRSTLAAVLLLLLTTATASAADIHGLWFTTGDKAKVDVKDCDGLLCGSIVWLKDPVGSDGQPLHDGNNEDPAMRTRPIMGLPILLGLEPKGENLWFGQVYSPEEGQTFEVELKLVSAERIEITGCGLGGLICETRPWKRASAEQAAN